jgi:adenylate kinase family enzyme
MRIVIIGNSSGGKSTLARRLSAQLSYPHVEVDALLWQPGWKLTPEKEYRAAHARALSGERWIIEGLGRQDSIPARLERATDIVLIDMPLWMHFWLAAERQIQWASGALEHPPAGLTTPVPLQILFRTTWEVDQIWMPEIRRLADLEEQRGKRVFRLRSPEQTAAFRMAE